MTNGTASSELKAARQLEGLVDDDRGRRVALVEELVDRQAQDQPIDDVHPLDAPVRRGFGDERVELGDVRDDALGERGGERGQLRPAAARPRRSPRAQTRRTSASGSRPTSH